MPRWPEEEGGSPLDAVTVWNPRAHLATGDQTTRPADRPKPAAGSRSSPKDGLTDMSCRTKTLPTTSSGFTTSAGTRKLRPGLFFVSISEETYLSPIAKWSVKTWNREPANHQLPHLHRYRRGSDRRNRSNPGRAPQSPSSPPRFFSFRLKNQPPTMPKIIVGDGSTLEEGCILDYVTFRHHPGQTPAQRAGAGGFFPRRDMMIMIGSDGARPGSSSLAGPSFCNQASAKPSHPPSLGCQRRRRRRRSLSSQRCYSCPHLLKGNPEDRTQNQWHKPRRADTLCRCHGTSPLKARQAGVSCRPCRTAARSPDCHWDRQSTAPRPEGTWGVRHSPR